MVSRKALAGTPLAPMKPVVLNSRDGLKMVSYLSLPKEVKGDKPEKPLPLVLLVHGGPWARDGWGFNPYHQLLTDRGYAVLSVNFRGSTGFGKKFVNAGNFEWGRKMHDDLLDAVEWAVREKIADPSKVAIMGGSYGGYAALAGLTFTPDFFACGVDIVGPSNLNTLLSSIPPYWTSGLQLFYSRMGDPRTPEGKQLLEERSPLNYVEKIKKPLLIAQGANDPRVKQAESDQIVKAMKDKGIPVTYALYPDEGHGFARPENNLAFMAVTEAFLKRHLGGEAEPVGKAFEGSSIQILEGKDAVPGI
jgi:dipeptidyl aminopeptidase/acylaminoacyl peptidase